MGFKAGQARYYLDLPTWRTLPSGRQIYIASIEDAKFMANMARDRYLSFRDNPKLNGETKEDALQDYQAASKFLEDFPKYEIRRNEKMQEQAVFPLEFDSPSGYRYVFDNWNELKNFEKPEDFSKIVDFLFRTDKRNRTKEQIGEDVKKDILYLRKKREEVYEKGHVEKDEQWKKGLTPEEVVNEYERRKYSEPEGESDTRWADYFKNVAKAFNLRAKNPLESALSAPPSATATPAPAPAAAPVQQQAAPQVQANQINEERQSVNPSANITPNFPLNVTYTGVDNRPATSTIRDQNEYDGLIRILNSRLKEAQESGDEESVRMLQTNIDEIRTQYTNALRQREAQTSNTPTQAQAVAQSTAPAQVQQQAAPAQARTRENFYGITEPNYPFTINFPEDVAIQNRTRNVENSSDYNNIISKLEKVLKDGREVGDTHLVANAEKALKIVKEQYANALNQRRERETPQYVTNPDGTVIDTRTHEIVDPERVQLASVQERSRQLTNRPFEENPYEANATQADPLISSGVNAIEQDFQNQQQAAPAPNNFRYPNRNPQQELASASYMRPNTGRHGFETLRDSILENSRQRAMRRFNRSMEDLGRQFSANRMGRNSMFDHMAAREFGDVMRDQNVLDHETELRLRALDENMRSGRAQFADSQYERNAQRALEEYRTNQLREEREHARRRQAASDAIAAGTLRQNMAEQNRSRQSAEFMRRQNHPRSELNSHLDTLRAASLGLPQMQQEERRNIPMPRLVPQAAPPTLERENAPYGAMPPAQAPTPNPDTTFRDIAGVVLGAGELGMNMAANRRNEQAHRANMAAMARQSANAVQPTSNTGTT